MRWRGTPCKWSAAHLKHARCECRVVSARPCGCSGLVSCSLVETARLCDQAQLEGAQLGLVTKLRRVSKRAEYRSARRVGSAELFAGMHCVAAGSGDTALASPRQWVSVCTAIASCTRRGAGGQSEHPSCRGEALQRELHGSRRGLCY